LYSLCGATCKSMENGLCDEKHKSTVPVSLGCVFCEKLHRQPHKWHQPAVSVGIEFPTAVVLCTADCFDKKPAKAKAPTAGALHPFGD
jgi:hypothetical protein